MSKYSTGNLYIVYFDHCGTKIDKKLCTNYMDGRSKIRTYLKDQPDNSAILERVIYNSRDQRNYE